jgi:hypothetical protein
VGTGTDPTAGDSDGDGLTDGEELGVDGGAGTGTDPLVGDTDGGGRSDGDEVLNDGTDPLDPSDDLADTDGDGLTDGEETGVYGTDPLIPDTDGDGLGDGAEVREVGPEPLPLAPEPAGIVHRRVGIVDRAGPDHHHEPVVFALEDRMDRRASRGDDAADRLGAGQLAEQVRRRRELLDLLDAKVVGGRAVGAHGSGGGGGENAVMVQSATACGRDGPCGVPAAENPIFKEVGR